MLPSIAPAAPKRRVFVAVPARPLDHPVESVPESLVTNPRWNGPPRDPATGGVVPWEVLGKPEVFETIQLQRTVSAGQNGFSNGNAAPAGAGGVAGVSKPLVSLQTLPLWVVWPFECNALSL